MLGFICFKKLTCQGDTVVMVWACFNILFRREMLILRYALLITPSAIFELLYSLVSHCSAMSRRSMCSGMFCFCAILRAAFNPNVWNVLQNTKSYLVFWVEVRNLLAK